MILKIISAQEILFEGTVVSVTLPGVMGKFTVLKNHAPLISVLVADEVVYRIEDGQEMRISIKGGLADVEDNVVSVCVY
jgi:F-type H+-transporting ATPase subunit epsilon